MFDILVYLYENFLYAEACPETRKLERKLSAAGFEQKDIRAALDWLSALQQAEPGGTHVGIAADSSSTRCFAGDETAKLSLECRGFVQFLVNAGVINALTRELIVERVMALPAPVVSLSRLKLIVLIVLWSQRQPLDTLVLEELLSSESCEGTLH